MGASCGCGCFQVDEKNKRENKGKKDNDGKNIKEVNVFNNTKKRSTEKYYDKRSNINKPQKTITSNISNGNEEKTIDKKINEKNNNIANRDIYSKKNSKEETKTKNKDKKELNNNMLEEKNDLEKLCKLKYKEFEEMKGQFKNEYNDFYNDLKEHNMKISNYNESLNRYYIDMNSIKNDLNSCILTLDDEDFTKIIEESKIIEEYKQNEKKYEDLDKMIIDTKNNIHHLEVTYNNIKNKKKKKNDLIEIIQQKFNEVNSNEVYDSIIFQLELSSISETIIEKLNNFKNVLKDLKNENVKN